MDRIRNFDYDCLYTAEYLGEDQRYERWWAGRVEAAYQALRHREDVERGAEAVAPSA